MQVKFEEYGKGMFIKIIREWTGLTQKEFAKILGVSIPTMKKYESGKYNYNTEKLEKICKEFGISIMAQSKKSH